MTTLLRCVKTAEDTSGRGEAASEAAIEAIGQEIAALHMDNKQQTRREATPEDLVAATKAVTEAVAGGQNAQNNDKNEKVLNHQVWSLPLMKIRTRLWPQ